MISNIDILQQQDPDVYAALIGEEQRQKSGIELIPSENYTFPEVLSTLGSVFTNKYSEGYPGRRYYGGQEYTDQICESMTWLGLLCDDELVYQSKRAGSYKKAILALLESGNAYRCFASKDELEKIRDKTGSYSYSGLWRDRSEKDIQVEMEEGKAFTVRLRVPGGKETIFDDLIYGTITVSHSELDDFIIARSDGSPVYNFTNVVDDSDMGITHVIRGEDHIANTPKQILIYQALGLDVPSFAHLPMILGQDKKRLSKRHGATGVQCYQLPLP